jgi:hypothetical protein
MKELIRCSFDCKFKEDFELKHVLFSKMTNCIRIRGLKAVMIMEENTETESSRNVKYRTVRMSKARG